MLHEYAATLSTAAIGNRSRRMMNVRKILDTTVFPSSSGVDRLVGLG
jgi:hypothetical protein